MIKMPLNQHEVAGALKETQLLLKQQRAQLKVTEGIIVAIQDFCEHPQTYTKHDYGGGSDTYCSVCGKCL